MPDSVDVKLFFNFRSPYCYIASKLMFEIFDDFKARLVWRPLGGWAGRSPPERAKVKIPLVRQDLRRIAARLGIPLVPPPLSTEPTMAAAASLLAEKKGVLKEWLVEVMRAEWGRGLDVGDEQVLLDLGAEIGLDKEELRSSFSAPDNLEQLERNWAEAQDLGLFGVPSFQIGDELFWGSDRIDYVREHLQELHLRRI